MLTSLIADLHTHPLGDRYCHEPVRTISREDRADISAYLHHLVARGVQLAACTDHDMVAGGLLGRELAAEMELPIIIVPGIEVSVWGKTQRLHLLALNVVRDLSSARMSVREAAREIHHQGGVAILAHPVRYPHEIRMDPSMLDCLDGLETWNGAEGVFNTRGLLDDLSRYDRRFILQTAGSDEHWERNRVGGEEAGASCSFDLPLGWLVEKKIIGPQDAEKAALWAAPPYRRRNPESRGQKPEARMGERSL